MSLKLIDPKNYKVFQAIAEQRNKQSAHYDDQQLCAIIASTPFRTASPKPLALSFVVSFLSLLRSRLTSRMARTMTNRQDVIIFDWAYHGHVSSTLEVSPYKLKRAGGWAKAS